MERSPRRRNWFALPLCTVLSIACEDDDAGRPLSLADVTRVNVSGFYCGVATGSCGSGPGATIDYEVDLMASTLTTTRCTPSDAGAPIRPETTVPLDAAQVARVQDALDDIRVVEAELDSFDGYMQALMLTHGDGTTSRYSPAATCGERRYQRVTQGFDALWQLVSGFDPG